MKSTLALASLATALVCMGNEQSLGAAGVSIENAKYSRIEVPIIVQHLPQSSVMVWMNNHQVLFSGHALAKQISDGRDSDVGIFVYDVRSRLFKRHADGNLQCFGDGYIRYYVRTPDGTLKFLAGPLGREQVQEAASVEKTTYETVCSPKEQGRPPAHEGINMFPLAPGHGHLDITYARPSTINDHVRLRKPDGEIVVLPFLQKDLRLPKIRFYPDKGVYLIYDWQPSEELRHVGSSERKRVGVPKQIYLLNPSGDVVIKSIPYHDWHRGRGRFYLAAGALLMTSRARDASRNVFHHEVFLIKNNRWEVVLDGGEATNGAVSPNGCLFAVGIPRTPTPNAIPLLNVVNLCEKGTQE